MKALYIQKPERFETTFGPDERAAIEAMVEVTDSLLNEMWVAFRKSYKGEGAQIGETSKDSALSKAIKTLGFSQWKENLLTP